MYSLYDKDEANKLWKEHHKMRLEYDEILDKCTFKPKINQNSKILAKRS